MLHIAALLEKKRSERYYNLAKKEKQKILSTEYKSQVILNLAIWVKNNLKLCKLLVSGFKISQGKRKLNNCQKAHIMEYF